MGAQRPGVPARARTYPQGRWPAGPVQARLRASAEAVAAVNATTHPGLKKHHLSTTTVVFMIFCLCAAGAYGIEDMISQAGPGLTLVMLMVLPFIWSTPMALVATELGSAIPEEGGFYKWVQRGLGEFWGFQAGWWRTISIYVDNTVYVVLAGAYFASITDLSPTQEYGFKAAIVVLFTWLNLRGLKDVGLASSVISLLVMIAFAGVAVIGFANWQSNPFVPFTPPDQTLAQSIGAGLAIGIWMYSGYESMSTMAGEVKDPMVIPRATLIAVPLIMAVYIFPTLAGLAAIGGWEQWSSEGGLSYTDVVTAFVPALGALFVGVAVLANLSLFNAYIASGSRGFFAMADDHLAPPALVRCSEKRGVPHIAVLSLGLFALLASMLPFHVIVVVDVMLFMSAYVLIFIAACVLRLREPGLERPFRIPLGNGGFIAMCVPPVVIACLALFTSGTDYFLGGVLALASGPVAYWIFKRRYGGLARRAPRRHPLNPRTGLAPGDTRRLAWMFGVLTLAGVIATLFLPGYEDPQTYAEAYGRAGAFEGLMSGIRWSTAAFAGLTVACGWFSLRLEPRRAGA